MLNTTGKTCYKEFIQPVRIVKPLLESAQKDLFASLFSVEHNHQSYNLKIQHPKYVDQ